MNTSRRRLGKNRGVKTVLYEKDILHIKKRKPNEVSANIIRGKMVSLFGIAQEEAEYFRNKIIDFPALTTMNAEIWATLLTIISQTSVGSDKRTLRSQQFRAGTQNFLLSKVYGAKIDNAIVNIKAHASLYMYYRYWIKNA